MALSFIATFSVGALPIDFDVLPVSPAQGQDVDSKKILPLVPTARKVVDKMIRADRGQQ
jgi:hypothetical protein